MTMEFLLDKLESFKDREAVASGSSVTNYRHLLEQIEIWRKRLREEQIERGAVVSFDGDYSAESIALFLALAENKNIIVPLSADSTAHHEEFRKLAASGCHVRLAIEGLRVEDFGKGSGSNSPVKEERQAPLKKLDSGFRRNDERGRLTTSYEIMTVPEAGDAADHPLYAEIRKRQSPGLVLFSSGSTGKSKAAVHDLGSLFEKFKASRQAWRTIVFLQLDHIGGINTLIYTLSNGGTIIVPADRSPATVCRAIQQHRAELLPTSPTFLNLLLLSGEQRNWDLSSLKLITYGTEPMPESTLQRLAAELPHARLQQTYGLSELGILQSKSRDSQSLWVKVGGEGFQTKIVDGRLCIKSRYAMLGYLNAPCPFDAEGYFDTGDQVLQDGVWIRILGRDSEIINVGGYKVFPAEVESVLLEMDAVKDAVVFGMDHAITGKIVAAKVSLKEPMPLKEFKSQMRQFCKSRLQAYKVPSKVLLAEGPLHSERFKRMRKSAED
ncbi:fatty acid--CoA ligase family protein [Desulforhabdus sp. TSK]|uniref:ANL family adenylate-forming protein n=1 Tax=Desulforhabdus sp. TSK TaxID=2925014 RepID=UPI001FC83DFF|nr:fatty acid--CoA ligase family protein [Desulforhabdus sp. TSK]GKT07863.1 AMP-dependent synthetase [Desulforhabdus sp. TSK]